MRITSKGQVTIPLEIRERFGSWRIPTSISESTGEPCVWLGPSASEARVAAAR